MARDLKINVDGNSEGGQKALEEAAAAAALAAKEANHLGDEFKKAERDAASLDKRLVETTAAAKALAIELAKNPADKTIKTQLDAQRKAATELKRLRQDIIGDTEKAAKDAADVAKRTASEFGKLSEKAAKDAETAAAKAAKGAEKAAAAAKKEWDDLVKKATGAEGSIGDLFAGGPLSVLTSGPGAVVGGSAAVVGTAAVGGALSAGVGAGVAGLGIAGAALGDPQAFSAAWGGVTSKLKTEFIDATKVFDGPGLSAIHSIGDAISRWDLKGLFAAAVPYVAPLLHGVEGFADKLVSGVELLERHAGPAIAVLAKELPQIGDSLETAFAAIASQSKGGADGLEAVLKAVGYLIVAFGYAVAGAEALTGALKDGTQALRDFGNSLPHWTDLSPAVFGYRELINKTTDSTKDSTTAAGELGRSLADVAASMGSVDQQASNAAAAVDRMNQSFDQSISKSLALKDANIGVAQGLADVAEKFKKGSDSLDINTQKGRDNQQLVLGLIATLEQQREAAIAAGDGTAAASKKADDAYNNNLAKLDQVLAKLLGSKKAAEDFLDTFRNVDFKITEHVVRVYDNPGVVPPRLPGSAFAHGGIRHAAAGLIVPPSDPGTVLIGEPQTGGEVLIPRKGIDVGRAAALGRAALGDYGLSVVPSSPRIPTHLFGSGRGSGPPVVNVTVGGTQSDFDRFMATWFMKAVRTGAVQISAGGSA